MFHSPDSHNNQSWRPNQTQDPELDSADTHVLEASPATCVHYQEAEQEAEPGVEHQDSVGGAAVSNKYRARTP